MKKDKELAVIANVSGVEKYKAKPTEELVEAVIQEIEAVLVERNKSARENTMLAFWETGQLIRKHEKDNKVNVTALVNRLAMDNRLTGRQMGERNIWFALKAYDSFPKFNKLYETEHGENISISKLKKMLVAPKPKVEKTMKELAVDIVARLGLEKAKELAEEILKEIKKQDK